jgi:hypothetical protein
MPLQIRRGTEAERVAMSQPLAVGEPVFTTDSKRLFIGDGTTIGGVGVTSYSDLAARDAAAAMFTTGAKTGITFTYNRNSGTIDTTVSALSSIQGNLGGDLVLNSHNITGSGNITITGSIQISGGAQILSDLRGDTYAVDGTSKILNNGTDGTDATLKAKVVNASNAIIIDPALAKANLATIQFSSSASITGTGTLTNSVPSNTFLSTKTDNSAFFNFVNIQNTALPAVVSFARARGNPLAPSTVVNGDQLFNLSAVGYVGGGVFRPSVSLIATVTSVPTSNGFNSNLVVVVNDAVNNPVNTTEFHYDYTKFNVAPVVPSYTTTARNGLTAVAGMIILNTTTNKFQGYANGAWVDIN